LWEGHRFEDVATPDAFARDPVLVHRFYNMRRAAAREVEPNAAHHAIARLETAWPGRITLVTQNVDGLHQRAGSRPICMHGELAKARCGRCHAVAGWEGELSTATACPACGKAGGMRPHIVWFGEVPMHMDEIFTALDRCDLFVAIGTSGVGYPAAGFASSARAAGARCIEFNLAGTEVSTTFHEQVLGPASQTVPTWVDGLLACGG
jgi:NAD-dependent deacetylase